MVKTLPGSFEFGQTQVVRENETRQAPQIIEGRSTLLMFTPETPSATTQNLFVEAKADGVSMGRYYMAQPDKLPGFVEDQVGPTDLPKLSTKAWSVLMPAGWIKPGVTLTVGYDDAHPEDNLVDAWRIEAALPPLAAPATFTVARAKFLLWGEANKSASTLAVKKLTRDYFAVMPVATLRTVDYTPARWDYIIWKPANGIPAKATSHAQYTSLGGGEFYGWMRQWAMRASMANTGRGLLTSILGDSSPYSYGTYVGQGLYRRSDGSYADMDDNGNAGDWTGWSAMWWGSECGNTFIHEVGHSMTLLHFDSGAAQSWGIASEYPLDGTYLPSHPQPFDTLRGAFRTWYRVNEGGAVAGTTANGLTGKRDPMVPWGENPDSQTCFTPYTAYHTAKAQRWMNTTPTLMSKDGVDGVYKWDAASRGYVATEPAADALKPAKVRVPVATLIGTLAAATSPDARQIYPAMLAQSGNTFMMPDPFQPDLPARYQGARYFLEIAYANGRREYTLIPQAEITDPNLLVHFSMNVALDDKPVQATLYQSAQPYPAITLAGSTALFTRPINTQQSVPAVVEIGKDSMRQAADVTLTSVCTAKTCRRDSVDVAWYPEDDTRLYFTASDANVGPTSAVSQPDGTPMRLTIPMKGPDGVTRSVIARASRTVNTPDGYRAFPANDSSPPPALLQGNLRRLVLWIDAADNAGLPSGSYTTSSYVKLNVHAVNSAGDTEIDEVAVRGNLIMPDVVNAGIDVPTYKGYTIGSTIYFVTPDPKQGPSSRIWSFASNDTPVSAQVQDTVTGALTTAAFRAQRFQCGLTGWKFPMNSGSYWSASENCEYGIQLRFVPAENPGLVSGRRYVTVPGSELVIEARSWRDNSLVGRAAFRWDLVMP